MVFKVKKNKNYTIMSNYHLRDKRLSLKAKGLLSFMLSLPEDWNYNLDGLCKVCTENRTSITNTLNELSKNGYLSKERVRNEKGCFYYEYYIYEIPNMEKVENNPEVENPPMDNPSTDYPQTDNQLQINTNIINTNEQIDKVDKTKSNNSSKHHFLTIDLINRKYITKDDTDIYNYDKLFEKLLSEYQINEMLTILHYIVPRVLENNFIDQNGNKIINKFGYLKQSILNNINKLNNNELIWDEELGWFKDNGNNLYEESYI